VLPDICLDPLVLEPFWSPLFRGPIEADVTARMKQDYPRESVCVIPMIAEWSWWSRS